MLIKVLREVKKCTYFEAQQVLRETYDTAFKVHDHMHQAAMESQTTPDKRRPLSLVAMHFAEEVGPSSRLYEKIELYFDREVGEHARMPLDTFLELPPEFTEKVLLMCQTRQQRSAKAATDLASQLANGVGPPKP